MNFFPNQRQKAFEQKQNAALFLQLLPWQRCSTAILYWLCDLSSAIKLVFIIISIADQNRSSFSKKLQSLNRSRVSVAKICSMIIESS